MITANEARKNAFENQTWKELYDVIDNNIETFSKEGKRRLTFDMKNVEYAEKIVEDYKLNGFNCYVTLNEDENTQVIVIDW